MKSLITRACSRIAKPLRALATAEAGVRFTVIPKNALLLSRKTDLDLRRNIKAIEDGTFTETHVKELLIDMREVAHHIKNGATEWNEAVDGPLTDMIEAANFIAHNHRNRGGPIDSLIRSHVAKIHELFEKRVEYNPLSEPVDGVLSANRIVLGIAGAASYFLSQSFEDEERQRKFMIFHERQNELALCVLSLLQDKRISLKKDSGTAFLHVHPHDGQYRLYCAVTDTVIERESKNRLGKPANASGGLLLNFPVMTSGAGHDNQLKFRESVFPPDLIETYRDEGGTLKVRIVGADEQI